MPDLMDWELLEDVRAADVREGDAVELPDRAWVWDDARASEGDARWRGVLVGNDSRLSWSRWHFVYGALDSSDVGTQYAADLDAECALEELHEGYVLLRIGVEQPRDHEHQARLVALHQFDLVRVQRPAIEPATPWVVLEHEGTAVHWDKASPGLDVYLVDWDEAEEDVEYVEAKGYELDQAAFLPDAVRAQLRAQLEGVLKRHRERSRD